MSWEIRYTDRHSGREVVHVSTLNESVARGWMKNLSREKGCKATLTHVADGPYDRSGRRTEIASEGPGR